MSSLVYSAEAVWSCGDGEDIRLELNTNIIIVIIKKQYSS